MYFKCFFTIVLLSSFPPDWSEVTTCYVGRNQKVVVTLCDQSQTQIRQIRKYWSKEKHFRRQSFPLYPLAAIEQPHVCCQMRCIFSVSLQSPTCYGKNICVCLKRLPEASQGRVCWAVSSWHQGVEVARWRGDSSCLGPGTCEGHALVQKHLKSQAMNLIVWGG